MFPRTFTSLIFIVFLLLLFIVHLYIPFYVLHITTQYVHLLFFTSAVNIIADFSVYICRSYFLCVRNTSAVVCTTFLMRVVFVCTCAVKLMKMLDSFLCVFSMCMCVLKFRCAELSWPLNKPAPRGLRLETVPVLNRLKTQSGSFLLFIWSINPSPSIFLCYLSFCSPFW